MSDPVVQTYAVYVLLSVVLTVWVARTLAVNGRRFLLDAFHGDGELADSVNHLLVVGFYLVNLGFVCFALATRTTPITLRASVELLSVKVGAVMGVLGLMHFFNLAVFSGLRSNGVNRRAGRTLGAPAPTAGQVAS